MRLLLASLLVMGIVSCGSDEIPGDIIPKDKMQQVLWDMMLADRFSAQYILKDSSAKDVKAETFKLYDQVFQVNKISREQFVKSYKYYLNRPDITKPMLDSLSAQANRSRDSIYKKLQ